MNCPNLCGKDHEYLFEISELYDGAIISGCNACGERWPRYDVRDEPELHHLADDVLKMWARRA